MVDQGILTAAGPAAEGISGFALIPLLPNSNDPAMKAWRAKWSAEYPNLPPNRPNIFDVLSYADMYVLATAMRNAGKDLTTAGLIDTLEHLHDYRVGPIASPRSFHRGPSHRQPSPAADAGEERRMGAGAVGKQAAERYSRALSLTQG